MKIGKQKILVQAETQKKKENETNNNKNLCYKQEEAPNILPLQILSLLIFHFQEVF